MKITETNKSGSLREGAPSASRRRRAHKGEHLGHRRLGVEVQAQEEEADEFNHGHMQPGSRRFLHRRELSGGWRTAGDDGQKQRHDRDLVAVCCTTPAAKMASLGFGPSSR